MKKVLLIAFVLTVFALGAHATAPVPFSIYAGGAVSVPSSPDGFKDGFNTGYHGMIGAGYKALPLLQIVGKVEYHNFGFDWTVSPTVKLFLQGRYVNVNTEGNAMSFIPVTVGLRFF